jgi:site-specific recombinase XerD
MLEAFFTDRLMSQRQASPHTIASYRDTFRLLLKFAQQRLHKCPSSLTIEDLDAPFLGEFLNHLEIQRGNKARSRNTRLAAIRSFFRYASFQEPQHSDLIQRVLAMPNKRYQQGPIEFLTRPEIDSILNAPDQHTCLGRRDRTLLLVAFQTGFRVSELTGLRCQDVILGSSAYIKCRGKGRKERCTPLRKEAVVCLRRWIRERKGQDMDPLFPNSRGGPLSRDGVEYLLAKHVATAQKKCPSLKKKRVSPHVLRHSTAMDLLHHGVDQAVIALWLGHEKMDTVKVYLHANLELKERALARTRPLNVKSNRFRPKDCLLDFLKSL